MSRFTEEQLSKARSVDAIEFLKSQGFEFEPCGSYMRCIDHDSLIIKDNGSWFWNSRSVGGNSVIDFLMKVSNMTFVESVKSLLDGDFTSICTVEKKEKIKPPFVLPPNAKDYRRAFAYLNKTRGIDGEIISKLMSEKKIYETGKYHNCAIIGYDTKKQAKHVAMWGTFTPDGKKPFKGEVTSSDKSYGFHMVGKTNTVYVYESPIDAMSHATIAKLNDEDYEQVHRISLCCTWDGALKRFLDTNKISAIVFCLDDDKAGNTASKKYIESYAKLGYQTSRERPILGKDFNEDLLGVLDKYLDDDIEVFER